MNRPVLCWRFCTPYYALSGMSSYLRNIDINITKITLFTKMVLFDSHDKTNHDIYIMFDNFGKNFKMQTLFSP